MGPTSVQPQSPPHSSSQPAPVFDEVASPSLSSSTALARFEYEAGKTTNDATKVLMVEWEDDGHTRKTSGQWHVSWKDRHSVLPAGEAQTDEQRSVRQPSSSDIHRLYFLLPPGSAIPPTITLTYKTTSQSVTQREVEWKTNPLPAIFPPELGASAREAGKKGVLHTLWAKKRIAVLQAEIDAEYKNNFEGIGLEMALQEKEWIESNFSVNVKPRAPAAEGLRLNLGDLPASSNLHGPPSPATPRSPGGGRLLEKLKGLRLGTNERDWAANRQHGIDTPPQTGGWANPLSPETSDVAISSFEAIKGQSRKPVVTASEPPRRVVAQAPPSDLLAQQEQVTFGMASLDGLATSTKPVMPAENPTTDESDKDDGLFALPMSPRSPDMTKSPFSFDAKDTAQYGSNLHTAS